MIRIAQDATADEVLTESPFALLMGMMLDQQYPMEHAFRGPANEVGDATRSLCGKVDAIGGIQQKMVGARNAGATVFLTPAANCADTRGAVPAGLRLVKVSTLSQAVNYLHALKTGGSIPAC